MPGSNYKTWINKTEDNLKWAKDNFKDGNYPLVCYLSQQAVELAVKGFIYSRNKIPPKTHQLIRLADECKKVGMSLNKLYSELAVLSEYYF